MTIEVRRRQRSAMLGMYTGLFLQGTVVIFLDQAFCSPDSIVGEFIAATFAVVTMYLFIKTMNSVETPE